MTEPSPGRKMPGRGGRRDLLVIATLALSVMAGLLFVMVFRASNHPLQPLRERQPGMDRAAGDLEPNPQSPLALGKLVMGKLVTDPGQPAPLPGDWRGFRGPKGDGVYSGPTTIARKWGGGLPAMFWDVILGEGYAGPAVLNGRVYLHDYDATNQADALRCLSLADGQEIWRFSYPVKVKRNHGMSRTTPAVTEKFIVSFGPKCHVACLEPASGRLLWGMDLVKDYGDIYHLDIEDIK
ncbi:MAG: hypothetical protein WCJ07_11045, partial [Verrucomicrobiota bacterium]